MTNEEGRNAHATLMKKLYGTSIKPSYNDQSISISKLECEIKYEPDYLIVDVKTGRVKQAKTKN